MYNQESSQHLAQHLPGNLSKLLLAVAVAATAAFPSVRAADPYPNKPLELIIPTPPGGGTDITGRLLAEQAGIAFGPKVVVINKPGAGGSVGLSHLTQVKPDGYTLA